MGEVGGLGRQPGPKPSFVNPFMAADGAAGGGLQPIRSAAAGASASADAPEEAEPSGFRPSAAHRVELLNHILRTPVEQGGAGLEAMQKADKKNSTILHIFPLQDAHANRALRRRAKRVNPFFGHSLEGFLRDVRAQYGEKVAFYYAFNAHYTCWLVVPSAVGGFLFTLSFFAEQQVQQFSPFFAAFMAIWGAAFCKAWKRRANRLALEWGTLNRRESEVVRKAFYGYPRTSRVTGELEAAYPQWRRLLKYMVTVVVIGLQVVSMCAWVAVLYFGYFYIQSTNMELWRQFLFNGLNSTVWGISLEFLNFIIFYKIAVWLNVFENHRTVQAHENRLIAKIFTFYFIDCFLWFFLLAFFQIPFGVQIDAVMNTTMHVALDKPFQKEIWMSRLGQTIGAVLSLTQWSMVFFADAYVPHKLRKRLLRGRAKKRQSPAQRAQVGPTNPAVSMPRLAESPSLEMPPLALSPTPTRGGGSGLVTLSGGGGGGGGSGITPSRAAKPADDPHERMSELLDQATMAPYDPILDYCGIVIQFGYVTFFSVVWQLAPLVCMLHTMFRRNSNLLRLDKLSMRPLPEPSSGIGLWDLLLKFTASFAVLINCMIVTVSTDQLDYFSCYSQSLFRDQGECTHGNVPMTSRFLIAAVAGYVILAIVFLIDNTLPDQQEEVNVRLKKAAYLFKRRYMESVAAERAMSGSSPSTTVSNLRVTGGAYRAINYDSDWGSGSDVSDAFEEVEVSGTRSSGINLRFAQ